MNLLNCKVCGAPVRCGAEAVSATCADCAIRVAVTAAAEPVELSIQAPLARYVKGACASCHRGACLSLGDSRCEVLHGGRCSWLEKAVMPTADTPLERKAVEDYYVGKGVPARLAGRTTRAMRACPDCGQPLVRGRQLCDRCKGRRRRASKRKCRTLRGTEVENALPQVTR